MRNISILSLLIIGQLLSAQQIQFNFESGNLNNWHQSDTGRWEIDTISPVSGEGSLHHKYDSPGSGYDMIARQHDVLCFDSTTTTWEFKVVYDYNPSSGNNWAFWLAADKGVFGMNPSGNTNGYLVGVNYTGSDDLLKVWSQNGGSSSTVFISNFNWQSIITPGDSVALRINRTVQGRWLLELNHLKYNTWQNLGSFDDTSMVKSEYFGVYYEYSSSQDRKLWIDDVAITGLFYVDKHPPGILSYQVLERNQLSIQFSEETDTSKTIEFNLNSNIYPETVQWLNRAEVVLTFDKEFSLENILEVTGIEDLKGNQSTTLLFSFNYYEAQLYDIIITEILADPYPSAGLPETEFIEILNQSPYPLNLAGWGVQIDEKRAEFSDITLYPGVYYIVTGDKEEWTEYEDSLVLGLSSFPSITNVGALIQLYDRYNKFISGVEYFSDMFFTERKQEGGWSIELIDLENACLQQKNWAESDGPIGGTPGRENSVRNNMIYIPVPEVERTNVLDSTTISIKFNLAMDSISVIQKDFYSLSEDLDIQAIHCNPPFFNEAIISFYQPLLENKVYELFLSGNISGCHGIAIEETMLRFGLPKVPEVGDVIINEVLFNSTDQVPEYIELFNNAESVIELRNCAIELVDDDTNTISKSILISSENLQFMPGDYFVLTQNSGQLIQYFNDCNTNMVFEPGKWLSLSNEGGRLALIDYAGNRINEALYSSDMHFSLLYETGGVSLEKIHPDKNGMNKNSWHSAATDVNYGTPTLQNSQFVQVIGKEKLYFEFSSTQISPDNDGEKDILLIGYNFPESGYLLSIKVFNRGGHLVNDLVNNELSGISGSISWDGLGENNAQLPMGYYILYLEAIHPEGDIVREKKVVMVLPQK